MYNNIYTRKIIATAKWFCNGPLPIILLCIHWSVLLAQPNLLINPGFEASIKDKPQSWIHTGTIDFYQNRSLLKKELRQSGNENPEYPAPAEGNNYIGIRAFPDATETTTGRLKEPLKKDQWYKISCRVMRPAADCNQPVEGVAVVLSDTIVKSKLWYGVNQKIPFLLLKTTYPAKYPVMLDSFLWMRVYSYYQAKGGERFLWVGNFWGANNGQIPQMQISDTPVTQKGEGLHCVYHYYYDAFAVEAAVDPDITLLTIRDITFDSGSATITNIGDDQMQQLLSLLRDQPDLKVEVSGHTDTDGPDAANLSLSAKRAHAVKNWITQNGIQPARIAAKGMGETQPVAPNTTPENKALNRRVDIKIIR